MSPFLADPVVAVAMWMFVKVCAIAGVAAIVQALLPARTSAAARHLVWLMAVFGLVALPLLSMALPGLPVITRAVERVDIAPLSAPAPALEPIASDRTAAAVDTSAVAPTSSVPLTAPLAAPAAAISPARLLLSIYATGVLVVLLMLALEWRSARRLTSHASAIADGEWRQLLSECAALLGVDRQVDLRRTLERSMPMTVGVRRPAILIPATAEMWSADRRRAVVLHELAHVARHDCLTQSLAFAACALYWCHPAAWWVARQLRTQRELACDDRVIAAGTTADDYAGHLLEIAYGFGRHRAPALAVSMATRPSHLEGRMRAVLDAARHRGEPTRRARILGGAIALTVILPVAAATSAVVSVGPEPEQVPGPDMVTRKLVTAPWALLVGQLNDPLEPFARIAEAAIGLIQSALAGTWELRPTPTPGVVNLRLSEVNSSTGFNIALDRFDGLTAADLNGAGGSVQFRLHRDAGTFRFEGVLRGGVAGGTYAFEANPAFAGELARRGYAAPTALEQYQMARADIGFAFIDELDKQGYAKPKTPDLVRAGQHGVNATYVSEMAAAGYKLGALDPLITLRDHGVTPSYIRELAALGYKGLTTEGIRQARDHGITPDYVQAMRDAGYTALTMEQLINARDHGVDPEYANGMRDRGYGSLTVDELINARDHGVDLGYVRDMTAAGFAGQPVAAMMRARDHGVTPDYVRDIKALGYAELSLAEAAMLRDHGLTVEQIKAANSRAGTRLPIDSLKSLASMR
jgi:beta-lactamase regulating signal transducer with metallopeptidase domain